MKRARKVTAEEAIKAVQSGQRVYLGDCCGEPQTLVEALVADRQRLENVELISLTVGSPCPYAQAGMEGHFHFRTFMSASYLREGIREGRVDYIPCRLSEIPRLFTDGYLPLDVALIQVSPADEHGYHSLGISVDFTKAAAESAKVVVAEVNQRMPRTMGDCFIHTSQLDYLAESSRPLLELPSPAIGLVERAIGQFVAELVPDRATIQLGLGAIPAAVVQTLGGKRDLGVHSGMFPDEIIELVESGAVTGAYKELNRGKLVATTLMGTEGLYRFVHDNPLVEMHPATYTHDAATIRQFKNFVGINSALQIDLTGQVNAETIGPFQVAGVGGQADFARGACLAPGGKSIFAFPSTASGGKVSRIVSRLEAGAAVTTPRSDVHFVVTEYGMADLRGKSLHQRARALIAIAHPAFREELVRAWHS